MAEKGLNIVVIGAGVAGMSAALKAFDLGASVTIIAQDMPYRSGSTCVRDGFSAAVGLASGDSPELHAEDTLRCGEFLASRSAVRRMCEQAPDIAELLLRLGLVFDRTTEGLPSLSRAAGSTFARTLSSGRSIGQRLVSVLSGRILRACSSGRLTAYYGWEFLSLIQDESGRARGVIAQELRNMEIKAFAADAVILCTGGYPAIFGRHCRSAANDGAAIVSCMEQGAAIANPEFVQVTPLAMSVSSRARSVPDSVLSSGGAVWIERDGKPWHFLKEWHGASGGAVPDDLVLNSLVRACKEAGARTNAARLDLTHLNPETIGLKMPFLLDACDAAGLDPSSETMDIAPAVRNSLGGLWAKLDHSTSIEGLFAAGSAVCLYHGACAMSGNDLLASVHGGMVAAESAVSSACQKGAGAAELSASLVSHAKERETDLVSRISAKQGTENAYSIASELSSTLFEKALIEKDNEQLARAAGKIAELSEKLARAQLIDRSEWSNSELSFHRRLAKRLVLADIYVAASIAREESRGGHRKAAIPKKDDKKWFVTTRAFMKSGKMALDLSERVNGEPGDRGY